LFVFLFLFPRSPNHFPSLFRLLSGLSRTISSFQNGLVFPLYNMAFIRASRVGAFTLFSGVPVDVEGFFLAGSGCAPIFLSKRFSLFTSPELLSRNPVGRTIGIKMSDFTGIIFQSPPSVDGRPLLPMAPANLSSPTILPFFCLSFFLMVLFRKFDGAPSI